MRTIKGTVGNDLIRGTKSDDYILASDGNDVVYGGSGHDVLKGGNGSDTLYGEGGNDDLQGEAGDDILFGADGDDNLYGGLGTDRLFGGSGSDYFNMRDGADVADGGDGNDGIMEITDDTVTGGAGDDLFLFHMNQGSVATVTDYRNGNDTLGLHDAPDADANAQLAGRQGWQYIGADAPTASLTNGNGQATISYLDGYTFLRLYNADGDFNADLTVRLVGNYAPEDVDLMFLNPQLKTWTEPALIFA